MPAFVDGLCAEYGQGPPSSTAPVLATGGTISTGYGLSRVAPAGAVTGVILAPGNRLLQQVWVSNESAFTITFAAAAVSNVADGAGSAIPANTARLFVWTNNLWYRAA